MAVSLFLILGGLAGGGEGPTTGVRLPAGGLLDPSDAPSLPQGPGVGAGAREAPMADEAQGPASPAGASTQPAAAVGSQEDKRVLQRRGGSSRTVELSGDAQAVRAPERRASSWPFAEALPLVLVLALIAGIALVVKRYMPVNRMLAGGGALDVVARLPLSGKQSLMLVKMGPKLVLVGVSPEQMASLAVVDDPEQIAAIVGQIASRRSDSISRSFVDALGDETKAYAEGPEATAAGGSVRSLLDKVRKLTGRQGVA